MSEVTLFHKWVPQVIQLIFCISGQNLHPQGEQILYHFPHLSRTKPSKDQCKRRSISWNFCDINIFSENHENLWKYRFPCESPDIFICGVRWTWCLAKWLPEPTMASDEVGVADPLVSKWRSTDVFRVSQARFLKAFLNTNYIGNWRIFTVNFVSVHSCHLST